MTIITSAQMPWHISTTQLQHETQTLLNLEWIPHYNTAHYTGNWDVLPLRTPGGSTKQAFADLIGEKEFRNTPLLTRCPYLQQLINTIQTEKLSIRLLNLKAGASIKPHRDNDLCFEQGEARLHIPVFTNNKAMFLLDEQPLNMQEGSCWYINANLIHSLYNRGNTDRIHLVVDCKVNDWFRHWMERDECRRMTKEIVADKEQTELIIADLYRQNTTTSIAIAKQLQSIE